MNSEIRPSFVTQAMRDAIHEFLGIYGMKPSGLAIGPGEWLEFVAEYRMMYQGIAGTQALELPNTFEGFRVHIKERPGVECTVSHELAIRAAMRSQRVDF